MQSSRASIDHLNACLVRAGVEFEILTPSAPTTTVAEAADALGCEINAVVKTLLFTDPHGRYVAAVASGCRRVDTIKLVSVASLSRLKLARPNVVLQTLGYSAGTVPPVALPSQIPVVVDIMVANRDIVYGGAGTGEHMLRIAPCDIIQLNNAIEADITVDNPVTVQTTSH